MTTALIGFTGFVGGTLDREIDFTHRYHSKNIREIEGKEFDTIYCAGVPAVKWLANKEPEQDLVAIAPLLVALEKVKSERFVLISTIDVYKIPVGVTEETEISTAGLHAYGTHRRMIELFVAERFPLHHIIRLPGLFGYGIKKNIIYDFLHDNQVDNIHADAEFQFYDLSVLKRDIDIAIDNGLSLVNFATESVSVRQVAQAAFNRDFDNRPAGVAPARYDMRSVHGRLFGGTESYLQEKDEVLERLKRFVASEQRKTQ